MNLNEDRQFWLRNADLAAQPLVMVSKSMPPRFCEHLRSHKSLNAVRQKHGHFLTPLQGACSSLIVPLVFPCWASGLPGFQKMQHCVNMFGAGEQPLYALSALVHPDFEFSTVMMAAIQLETQEISGQAHLAPPFADADVKRWLVYHFTRSHRLPSVEHASISESAHDVLVINGEHVLSHEMLRNIVNTQINLEQRGLDLIARTHSVEFVYTWDPPTLFAQQIGVEILDELFLNAITQPQMLARSVKAIAFNDYKNSTIIPRLKTALPHLVVTSSSSLPKLQFNQYYVVHSNSDGFAEHILTQPVETSREGAIGASSSAAASLCCQDSVFCYV